MWKCSNKSRKHCAVQSLVQGKMVPKDLQSTLTELYYSATIFKSGIFKTKSHFLTKISWHFKIILIAVIEQVTIDECAKKPCHAKATCTNTKGSYKCKYTLGWKGDGKRCASKGWYVYILKPFYKCLYIHFSGFTLPWHFKNKIKNWIWLSPIFPFKFPSLRMTPVEATYIQLPLLSGSGSSFVYNNWSIVGLYTRNSDLKSILLILLFFVELRLRARPGIASGMSLRSPIMLIVSAGLGCLALF